MLSVISSVKSLYACLNIFQDASSSKPVLFSLWDAVRMTNAVRMSVIENCEYFLLFLTVK